VASVSQSRAQTHWQVPIRQISLTHLPQYYIIKTMNKSETIASLAAALNKAQAEMSGAKKSAKNPFFKSNYANLEEVINCVKEPFANNGLSFVQFPISGEGLAGVETIIMHESGEFIANEFMLKCAKNDPQGMGSAITYARRYGLQSAVGIPSEDDDGEGAMQRKPKAPLMKKEDAVSKLGAAKTLEELGKAWNNIPIDLKQNEDVESFKNIRKDELTTAAK
jgi:hypothetical protein